MSFGRREEAERKERDWETNFCMVLSVYFIMCPYSQEHHLCVSSPFHKEDTKIGLYGDRASGGEWFLECVISETFVMWIFMK